MSGRRILPGIKLESNKTRTEGRLVYILNGGQEYDSFEGDELGERFPL
jgi:hypothetical protein